MQIKLLRLNIKNFKGIKDYTVDFQGRNTNIFGANATGKTTIFDAFKWLFFDKDSSDRKDFNIKTLDKDNKPIHFLEHCVELVASIDGTETVFKKVLQEKWVKKRGQAEQEFAGHETSYWIDEVPAKKKEYDQKINNLIEEKLFKLITDPQYFNNLPWQEKREILFKIAEISITDEEILKSREELKLLLDKLEGRSVEDYKKVLYSKIKELKAEKEKIPIRIDELNTTLLDISEEIDYKNLENIKRLSTDRIEEIDKELLDYQKRVEENNKIVNSLSIKKIQLNDLQNKLENEQKNQISNKKVELDNKINEINNKLANSTTNISNFKEKIKQYENERAELRLKFDEVKNKTFEISEDKFICPTCKQPLPLEEKEKQLKQLKDNFNTYKKTEIESINNQGINAKNNQEQYETWLKEHEEKIKALNEELVKVQEELSTLEEQSKIAQASAPFVVCNSIEFKNLCNEVKELEEKVNNLTSEEPNQELIEEKKNLEKDIAEINEVLAKKEIDIKTRTRIGELTEQEELMSQQIQEMEQQQYLIEEFTKTKVDIVTEKINSKFKIVKFRLFNTQINGGIVECCDTLVNGVPYSDVNNAHKIIAGLDIINTLSKYYNVSAPIFIDNAESIVTRYDIDTQVIRLVVSNDTSLRLEVEK